MAVARFLNALKHLWYVVAATVAALSCGTLILYIDALLLGNVLHSFRFATYVALPYSWCIAVMVMAAAFTMTRDYEPATRPDWHTGFYANFLNTLSVIMQTFVVASTVGTCFVVIAYVNTVTIMSVIDSEFVQRNIMAAGKVMILTGFCIVPALFYKAILRLKTTRLR